MVRSRSNSSSSSSNPPIFSHKQKQAAKKARKASPSPSLSPSPSPAEVTKKTDEPRIRHIVYDRKQTGDIESHRTLLDLLHRESSWTCKKSLKQPEILVSGEGHCPHRTIGVRVAKTATSQTIMLVANHFDDHCKYDRTLKRWGENSGRAQMTRLVQDCQADYVANYANAVCLRAT